MCEALCEVACTGQLRVHEAEPPQKRKVRRREVGARLRAADSKQEGGLGFKLGRLNFRAWALSQPLPNYASR